TEQDLLASTVRLRVFHGDSLSHGTGTIIDARNGEALVLTCGHLFRDSQGRGRIEVDVFGPTPQERLPGTLVHFDADRDVGLVSIRPPHPVKAARVAPTGYKIAKGTKVFSVGCDGGQPPSVRPGVVTSLDRFLGPPNLTASGLPVEGRSGGGLVTSDGLVIGVCNAALPEEREGFYAALGSIHAVIDTANLSFVYRPDTERPRPSGPMVAVNTPAMPRHMPPPEDIVQPTDMTRDLPASGREAAPPSANPKGSLTPEERAALEEIHRRKAAGAEVICVIRPRDNPQARSEIIVLDRASPEFLRSLTGGDRESPHKTGVPENAASPLPPPPGVSSMRNAVASSTPKAEVPEWKPRWLQPGYQGE
ncbi:MAG: serine protease, partial [Thermoguttaceae bacterium]|nr:serine protease [Thermoguttaceae bacterium]